MILKCYSCDTQIDTSFQSVTELQNEKGEKLQHFCTRDCIDNTIVL